MLRIGPSGNSLSFYESGRKHTFEAAKWLADMGLNAYEYSFGRGVKMSDETAAKIRSEMDKYGMEVSVHAPYYTNFSNPDPEMIDKSISYVYQSLTAVKKLGGKRVVFHPASQGKAEREEAVALARDNIAKMMAVLGETLPFSDYILCPETMGKIRQIGTVEEIVSFCKLDPHLYPCYDFGHINCYMHGGLKTEDDYRRIIDYTFAELGEEKAKNIHIHFSKIQYGESGEIRHLTFADTIYGPEYAPLAKIIDEYRMTPFIVCESDGTMAEDALNMKKHHKNV